ncbi:MAG: M20/M25/M40 family metallo-hydrolase [Anaerolineales bacterium]|nr:M20/M25/M40 family metallo-hydrolase [Anaerolineales bacterium]
MTAFDLLTHLKTLCTLPGLPGHEGPAREVIRAAWTPLVSTVRVDPLGSLWARRAGGGPAPRPTLLLAAHMDAIGMMVTRQEGDFLRVTNLGGIDPRVLPGQTLTVHGRRDLPAVAAQPPAHLLPKAGRDQVTPLTELVVDTGLPEAELRSLVQVGDLVSFAQPPLELLNGHLAAHSLDNRASVAALTLCLRELQTRAHAWDVLAVATVQEETGLKGAGAAAFAAAPDLAVAVDVTFGRDANVRDLSYKTFALGGGPSLGVGPNIHPGLLAAFRAAAERADIPYALEPLAADSGTDGWAMQVARAGIPTLVMGIPLRNMHTPVEIVALSDITRTGRLLAEFVSGLEGDFMSTLGFE